MFGGTGCSPEGYLNDHGEFLILRKYHKNNQLICYDPNTQKWKNPQCFGAIPFPRSYHASTAVKENVFLLGGFNQGFIDDFIELNMHSLTWTEIQTVQPSPRKCSLHTTLTAITDNLLVFHGAVAQKSPTSNDSSTWSMDLRSSSWRQYTSGEDHSFQNHASSLGLHNNVIIMSCSPNDIMRRSTFNISHVMLESKSLQKLALYTIYKHLTKLPWKCLPKKLIALLDMSKEEKHSEDVL